MPCYDYDTHYVSNELSAKCDKLTRMLCETLRELESRGDKDTDYMKNFLSKETIEWWQKHTEADAKRREQEAYDKQMAEKIELEEYYRLKAKYETWR